MNDNHVGYCRYLRNDNGEAYSIEICNSDDEGAFKVYRNSDRALLEDMVKIIETYMKRAKRNEPVSLRSEKEFVSFLARAKEVLE